MLLEICTCEGIVQDSESVLVFKKIILNNLNILRYFFIKNVFVYLQITRICLKIYKVFLILSKYNDRLILFTTVQIMIKKSYKSSNDMQWKFI